MKNSTSLSYLGLNLLNYFDHLNINSVASLFFPMTQK